MKRNALIVFLAGVMVMPSGQAQPESGRTGGEQQDGAASRVLTFLLPRSLQSRPWVDFNIITEMTSAGRERPEATPANPLSYHLHPAGYQKRGIGAPADEQPPAPEVLMDGLRDALAQNGYFEMKDPEGVPDILLITNWGSYSTDWESALDAEALVSVVLTEKREREELIERASLVGGVPFAAELQDVLNAEVQHVERLQIADRVATRMAEMDGMGGPAPVFSSTSPFYRFLHRDARTRALVERTFSSIYFMVASAYDFRSASESRMLLLWRTKMTVESSGVAIQETLPRLISNASPYLGRDMPEATTVRSRINRKGTVEIGPATVIDEELE